MNTFNELPAQITQNTQSGQQFEINTEDRHDDTRTNDGISFEDVDGKSYKKSDYIQLTQLVCDQCTVCTVLHDITAVLY